MITERTTRLAERMRAVEIDYLILSRPSHVLYLTGLKVCPGDRLFVAVLDAEGRLSFVCNRMLPMPESVYDSIVWYHDCDNGVFAVSSLIGVGSTVGIDSEWTYGYASSLASIRTDLSFTNGSALIEQMRMIKDDAELELLRISSRINDKCMSYLVSEISGDLSEKELSEKLFDYHASLGQGEAGGGAIISYGVNAVDPHHFPDGSRLRPGDSVVMDFGFSYKGYLSDMTRTVFFREVPAELEKIYRIVLQAQEAAIALIRPGRSAGEIDEAARALIRAYGYEAYFPHRTGHGIGLDVHEPPFISSTSDLILLPGMVFSVEPGIYVPGLGGVRIEDLVIVTGNGAENLNSFTKELTTVS